MILTTKLYPAHPLTLCRSICVEVKHDWIKTQDVSGLLMFANVFASTAQNAWNTRGSVQLVFAGFCSDPRELWEIPEVRSYVNKVTEAWPAWMFFLDTSQTIPICFLCLAQVERTADPSRHRVVDPSADVLAQGFHGLNQMCAKYKISDEVRESSIRDVVACIGWAPIRDSVNSGCGNQVTGSAV